MEPVKIIYIMSRRSSFVDVDLSILSEKYDVLINTYNWANKKLVPLNMARQLFFLLRHSFSVKTILISSGGYWSLLPAIIGRIFRIPVMIILNGSECASFPSINYGNLRSPLLRSICRISYKYCTTLLPVSESLVKTKNTYYLKGQAVFQGYQHFFPSVKTDYRVIFNGIDHEYWKTGGETSKEKNSFISVFSPSQYILKGGDLIVAAAAKFPDCTFYMAGLSQPAGIPDVPSNIHFLGHLKPHELREYYSRCRFHFQLSIFEGFGCTLCEAMLCQCVPIGSGVNIIPEIIGNTGFILSERDVALLEKLIANAIASTDLEECGEKARQQIIANYSIENRKNQLFSLIAQNVK